MGVNGGSRILQRVREACTRGFTRPLSRTGKGVVLFASTNEVLSLVYRPSLTVRDVCIEAALIVNISPVVLDFFTLVSENGQHYLNPQKVLFEEDCNQRYHFRLSFKACFGSEIRDFDGKAFEYYFHQCRQDFLRGTLGQCTQETLKEFVELLILEVLYQANETHGLSPKAVIENPRRYGIRRLFKRGVFREYPDEEIKKYVKGHISSFENLRVDQIKSRFITILEMEEDFFVHKLSLEKVYVTKTVRKFEILVSAEFGIKKRRIDVENSYPEEIVKEFSEVEGLDLDPHSNKITIFRSNKRPEVLMSNSAEEIHSLTTLIEGYYRLMVNQYKELSKGKIGPKRMICHGPIERRKAELLLHQENRGDGFCLLRRKRNDYFSFVLSLCVTSEELLTVKHYQILWDKRRGQFHLESDSSKTFSGLGELVEHYRQSKDGLPVCLKSLCLPKTEGFSALLDRQVMVSTAEDVHLVGDSFQVLLKDLNISRTNLSVQKGEFGVVKKGTLLCPASDELEDVVSRALLKSAAGENIRELRKAIQQMSVLQNPYLIQFHGVAETDKALLFVFEFGADGPLDRYIKENSGKEHGITKGRVVSYAAQIAEGMMFLHSENCIHGRLMARNIIVANEECVKISDAGLLPMLQKGLRFHQSKRGYGYNYCWFSPLALQKHTFSFASDIWAFGMTLWEMFAMKEPFHSFTGEVLNEQQVMTRYLKGQYLNPNRLNCPDGVAELVKRCWAPVPEERISFCGLVAELQSPKLVPEVEALQVLLPPNPSLLEDWEKEMFPQREEMELHPVDRSGGSQVSDVDYSCLPAADPHENSSNRDSCSAIPGSPSAFRTFVFDTSGRKKRTLSKTFSHPGSPSEIVEALSCREPPHPLELHKPSFTRVSSCPPAIQLDDEAELQRDVRYVSTKSMQEAPVGTQVKNSNPKLFPSLEFESADEKDVSRSLEISKYASGCHDDDDGDDDEWQAHDKEVGNNDDDDCFDDGNDSDESGDDDDTESNAELMAMRSLGVHITGKQDLSIQPTKNLVSSGETIFDTIETSIEDVQSLDSTREPLEQMPETGSQKYVTLTSNQMAISSDNRILDCTGFTGNPCSEVQSEHHSRGMHVAGSYVDLCSMNKASRSWDQLENSNVPEEPFSGLDLTKNQGASFTVRDADHSADKTYLESSLLPQLSLDNYTPKEKDSDSVMYAQSNKNVQSPRKNVGLEYTETVCQVQSEKVQMTSNDVEMLDSVSASPDEFLASLVSHHQQQTGPLPYPSNEFYVEPKEDAGNEMTMDDEEGFHSDDAEWSLGNLFSQFDANRLQSSTHQYFPMTPMQSLASSEQNSNQFTQQQHSVLKDEHPYFMDQTNRCNPLYSADLLDGFTSSVKVDKLNTNNGFAFPGAAIENQELWPSIGVNFSDNVDDSFLSEVHQTTTQLSEEQSERGSNSLPLGFFWPSADTYDKECLTDEQLEHLEMDTTSLNNLSKESSTEGLHFCDDHYSRQGSYSSYTNQFDEEACAKGNSSADVNFIGGGAFKDLSSSEVQPGDAYKYHSGENLKREAINLADIASVEENAAASVDGHSTNPSISLDGRETSYHQHLTHLEQKLAQPLHRSPSSDSISSSEDIWSTLDLSSSQQFPGDLPRISSSSDVLERTSFRKTSLIGLEKEIVSKSSFDISKIPRHLQVQYEQVRQKEFLGEGQFGKVNRAEIISTEHGKPQREDVAVKVLKKNASEKESEDFKKEVENMIHIASKQNCEFIIKLRGVCIDKEDSLMLITELAPYGSLKSYLPKNKDILGISQLLEYSVQICKGMNYLEKQRLLHRDLATRNILVMQEDRVKISDFGLSRLENYYKTYGKGFFPLKWYALESITLGRFTPKSDVWSFGVTMWEIFTYGNVPYKDMDPSELHLFLEDGNRLSCPPSCPEKIYDLMLDCWSKEGIKRPSFYLLCNKFVELQKVYAP